VNFELDPKGITMSHLNDEVQITRIETLQELQDHRGGENMHLDEVGYFMGDTMFRAELSVILLGQEAKDGDRDRMLVRYTHKVEGGVLRGFGHLIHSAGQYNMETASIPELALMLSPEMFARIERINNALQKRALVSA